MTFVVALMALMSAITPSTAEASVRSKAPQIAKHYSPGVMEHVPHTKARAKYHLPPAKHLASVPYCSRIGQWVDASVNGHRAWFLVVDCSDPTVKRRWNPITHRYTYESDQQRHIRTGLVIEVSYADAKAFGFVKQGHAPAHIYGYRRQ